MHEGNFPVYYSMLRNLRDIFDLGIQSTHDFPIENRFDPSKIQLQLHFDLTHSYTIYSILFLNSSFIILNNQCTYKYEHSLLLCDLEMNFKYRAIGMLFCFVVLVRQ